MALNKKQKDAMELLISRPFIKKCEVAKELQVNPNTVSEWFKRQDFLDEWDRRLAEEWKDSIRNAQRKMNELVEQGDYRAIQYVLDAGGFKATDKLDINADASISINIDYGEEDGEH